MRDVLARAPGRVNLIGDHTDTSGGWCLPMAIDLATEVRGTRGGYEVFLQSESEPMPAVVPIEIVDIPSPLPLWARYVAGVVAELRPTTGFHGTVRSDLPTGAGLSSSAALEVAVALALGFEGGAVDLARLCQRAEQRAVGVPCGIMDQLASTSGRDGHALLLDCASLDVKAVPMPPDVEVIAVHSGDERMLATSAYGERRRDVEAGIAVVGLLRATSMRDLDQIDDEIIRRRARHVVSENDRTREAATALASGDVSAVGELMKESHASLRDDFEVSTPNLDALVEHLVALPGVLGARMTGAGFGGCVVALCRPGAVTPGLRTWRLKPSGPASVCDGLLRS